MKMNEVSQVLSRGRNSEGAQGTRSGHSSSPALCRLPCANVGLDCQFLFLKRPEIWMLLCHLSVYKMLATDLNLFTAHMGELWPLGCQPSASAQVPVNCTVRAWLPWSHLV